MDATPDHPIMAMAAGDPAAASGGCPVRADEDEASPVSACDELVLPHHRRTIVQYAADAAGVTELRLYYGDKEISFDDPDLFAFGEALARTARFTAQDAMRWGGDLEWPRVRALLGQLLDAGVLARAETAEPEAPEPDGGVRPSPLPTSTCPVARTWTDCESITRELTGVPVEPGHLELVVPIFRVAHSAVDADDRQIGEANVFPRALRLDVPTEWRTCRLPGSRFQAERPMNVTAMRTMRAHWPQMMAALLHIRAGFLRRFPDAGDAWTVGHLERFSTAVLAVPTWQLMKRNGVGNGRLHPALSSLFRVTDGVRMVMHQMLFIPVGEPTLSPDAPVTIDGILDYAERNHSFHSDYAVCAGPRAMVRELLQVLMEGRAKTDYAAVVPEAPVRAALDGLDAALDYGLYGLQAYAAVFSLWPVMTRAYENLAAVAETWPGEAPPLVETLRTRMRRHLDHVRRNTLLGSEEWRIDREAVYADMYRQCGLGLPAGARTPDLEALLSPVPLPGHAAVEERLLAILRRRLGRTGPDAESFARALTTAILDFLAREQAVLRAANAVQARINALLGRAPPARPFGAAEIDVHNLLLGTESRRLPYLIDELEQVLGIVLRLGPDSVSIAEGTAV